MPPGRVDRHPTTAIASARRGDSRPDQTPRSCIEPEPRMRMKAHRRRGRCVTGPTKPVGMASMRQLSPRWSATASLTMRRIGHVCRGAVCGLDRQRHTPSWPPSSRSRWVSSCSSDGPAAWCAERVPAQRATHEAPGLPTCRVGHDPAIVWVLAGFTILDQRPGDENSTAPAGPHARAGPWLKVSNSPCSHGRSEPTLGT